MSRLNDGLEYALVDPQPWESILYEVGFKTVEWTEVSLPESFIQRLIPAMAADGYCKAHVTPITEQSLQSKESSRSSYSKVIRQNNLGSHIHKYMADFSLAPSPDLEILRHEKGYIFNRKGTAIVTGTTGILGSHLVQHLLSLDQVHMIISLNRQSGVAPRYDKNKPFSSGISSWAITKFQKGNAS